MLEHVKQGDDVKFCVWHLINSPINLMTELCQKAGGDFLWFNCSVFRGQWAEAV